MATYVSLINWTQEGIKDYRDTVKRYRRGAEAAERMGGKISNIWWTVGPYDLVVVSEFADDETATAFALALGSLGFVRTTTLRAFGPAEMEAIIARAG